MNKRIVLILFVLISLLLFGSCDENGDASGRVGDIIVSEPKKADARMEQIISAIKDKDKEALKSLFSKKALDETDDFDNGTDYLFDFLQGDIDSWERDGWSSSGLIENGKKSLMIRFSIIINTDKDDYLLFVIDYNMDTIDPDNEGVYMLQIMRLKDRNDQPSWQERLCAGIYKPE
jgi:hypothetical protein